jgi:hypothetical protein
VLVRVDFQGSGKIMNEAYGLKQDFKASTFRIEQQTHPDGSIGHRILLYHA